MTGGWGKTIGVSVGCAVAFGGTLGDVNAQSGGGFDITVGLSNTLSFTDNDRLSSSSAGVTTDASTNLSFGIASTTPVSSLSANVSTSVKYEDAPGEASSLDTSEPRVSLRYRREGATSNLSFDASYTERAVSDFSLLDSEDIPFIDDLIVDGGDVTDYSFGLRFNSGVGTPLSFSFSAANSGRDYVGTSDPDLYNSTTTRLTVGAIAQISPVARARVFANYSEVDSDDPESTNREGLTYGVGLIYDLDPVTRVETDIAFSDFTNISDGFGIVTVNETSIEGSVRATRTIPNGTLTASVSTDASAETTRITAQVGREVELPDRTLSTGLGVSTSDTGSTALVGNIGYTQELSWGSVSAGFSQSAFLTGEDEEVAVSRLGLGYMRELSPTSAAAAELALVRTDDIGVGFVTPQTRADFTVTYSQELTPDWDWTLGYVGKYSDSSGGESAISHGVFVTLDRDFELRP